MNLNYPVSDIAKWINAKVVGNSDEIVHHVSFDSRSPLNNSSTLFFAMQGNNRHGHDYISDFVAKGGRMMVVEKEQDVNNCVQLVVENSITALQLLAQKHRQQYNIPVIGITGSNGKTTVKEWLFHILKDHFIVIRSPKSYNSQIGVPLSILEITNSHQIAIIEAGISFPGEMIKLEKIIKPTIGIFTGIGLAHQINFSSLEEKESEKMKLFNNVETLLTPTKLNLVSVNQIPFNNPASILNASLAKAAALHLGLSESEVDKALLSLPYVSMRMEQMEGANGNVLINDTYTFDEKGLEISLKSLNQIGIDKQKVAILAPDPSYKSGTSLRKILNASGINILIWISAEEVPNNPVGKSIYSRTNGIL